MIDAYFWRTPNGWKLTIALEEMALPYRIVPVDIYRGGQLDADFRRVSPNGKIPAIVDHAPVDAGEPVGVFESAAVLLYLAEKTGRFLPTALRPRKAVLEWLAWQISGLGPTIGQTGHFRLYAREAVPYALQRFDAEMHRLYGVLDGQLARNEFVAGSDYTIADMACWPWVLTYKAQALDLDRYPHVRRWYKTLQQRPGLRRGYAAGGDLEGMKLAWTDEMRSSLLPTAQRD